MYLTKALKMAPSYNVLVVGAGLAGLNTSIALALQGHKITVLERSTSLRTIGLGMLIPPQASRLLDKYGVFQKLADMNTMRDGIEICRWENGEVIGRSNFRWQKDVYGYP